jgi:hypothetical protein
MRTPEQATDEARTRLEKRWHLAITGTASADWPFRIPLGTPPKALLERDFKTALTWARTWEEWAAARHLALDWRNRIVTGTTQPLPTHVTIPDADTAARLCGGHWPGRLAEARRRLALVRNAFPDADHPRVIRGAESLSVVDFQLLLDAARWFTTNSATGLTPRQVPLPGFHGKWLNRNQPLILALSGREDLGLSSRPTRVHFTYLDLSHRANGGRRHESITIGDRAESAYEPEAVIILENKDTAVYFPSVPGGIAVEGEGTKAPGTLPLIPWIRQCRDVIYWGDIDAGGLSIVNDLRAAGVNVETMLMDYATYEAYEQFGAWTDEKGKPVPCSRRRKLPALTLAEQDMYQMLTDPSSTRVRRVEQERIPLEVAAEHLDALLRKRRDTIGYMQVQRAPSVAGAG